MTPTRRRGIVTFLSAVIVMAAVVSCDSASPEPVAEHPRQVTVVGNGQVQGVPDTLTADVSVEFTATDVTTAMNQTNDRQKAVISALVAGGIDAKDISTTQVSVQPQYDVSSTNSVIVGYEASNSIRVKMRKLDQASQALATIVTAGGNAARINSVSYSIEDDSKLMSDARARAFHDAEDRARQYAGLSGLTLGKVMSISEAAGSTPPPAAPMPMRGGVAAASEVPLQPGEQTVSFAVTAVWELS